MGVENIGALCFGVVMGWVTYRTLRRTREAVALSNIATVLGAVGGAAVTSIFASQILFSWYCIGLTAGFFGYLAIAVLGMRDVDWLSRDD